MNLIEIFSIILIHWFCDFVLQTDKQAKGKSKNWEDLLGHTLIYSTILGLIMCFILPVHKPYIGVYLSSAFFLITLITHTITDYFTSRLNSKLFPESFILNMESTEFGDNELIAFPKSKFKLHNFFVSVGFDQVLHYVQLFTTYYYLKNG